MPPPDRRAGAVAAVLAALSALCPMAALAAAQDFVCRGREPSWEFRARGAGQATFVPDKGAQRSLAGTSADLAAEGVVVWRGRPAPGGDGATAAADGIFVAVMLKGACTDLAAGEASTHSVVLSLPNAQAVVGCCSYGPGAVATAAAAAAVAPPATPALAVPPPPSPAPQPAAGPPRTRTPPPPAAPAPSVATVSPPAKAAVAGAGGPETRSARPERPERAAGGLMVGARARVAGPARERVLVSLEPSERGRVAGSVRGGQAVVVGEAAPPRGGRTWYRITGKDVPDRAWIRGDLLAGGGG